MHSVNLDLLRTVPHHPDGMAKDPHAYHEADHRAELRARRRARLREAVARVFGWVAAQRPPPTTAPCPKARR